MKINIEYRKEVKHYKGRTAFERDYDRVIFSTISSILNLFKTLSC